MNVTSVKIIVGNPIDSPALNASKIERLFYVGAGGVLDVRSVTLYKGGGRRLDDGRLKLTIGAVAYVALGGAFTATGYVAYACPNGRRRCALGSKGAHGRAASPVRRARMQTTPQMPHSRAAADA